MTKGKYTQKARGKADAILLVSAPLLPIRIFFEGVEAYCFEFDREHIYRRVYTPNVLFEKGHMPLIPIHDTPNVLFEKGHMPLIPLHGTRLCQKINYFQYSV